MVFLRVLFNSKRGVGKTVARVAKCSMIIKRHKQLHALSPPPLALLFFWSSFIPPSPPDAYHCGRSIKCNVCRRGIIGNMWWELKMLSHFKLPIICSKGVCIVLQSAWKKGGRRGRCLSAALGSAEMFIRRNNRRSLLALVFLIMLFFAKNTTCGVTSLNSVIICHGEEERTIDNVRKDRQGITGTWTQD